MCVNAVAAAACPEGCDKCQLDANGIVVCTSTGCSDGNDDLPNGYFYALNGQCVGQLQQRVRVSRVTVSFPTAK